MKKSIIFICTIIIVASCSAYIGFRVGSEKMWANSSVYFASGEYFQLEQWNEPPGIDTRNLQYENRMRRHISETVQVYGRYKRSWTSKLDLGLGWDNSTQSIMSNVVNSYLDRSEVDYKSITFEEYWEIVQSRDPKLYSEVKIEDPELYKEFEEDVKNYLENIKYAIEYSRL